MVNEVVQDRIYSIIITRYGVDISKIEMLCRQTRNEKWNLGYSVYVIILNTY